VKKLAASILFVSAAALAPAADDSPLTGSWQIHNSIAGNESDQTCTFTQKANELTGNCKTEQGSGTVTGKIDDKKVTWEYKSEYNGGPITLTYTGTLGADKKIVGTVNVQEYGVDGDFTATPSK